MQGFRENREPVITFIWSTICAFLLVQWKIKRLWLPEEHSGPIQTFHPGYLTLTRFHISYYCCMRNNKLLQWWHFCRSTQKSALYWLPRQNPNRIFSSTFRLFQKISFVTNKSLWFLQVLFIIISKKWPHFFFFLILKQLSELKKLNVSYKQNAPPLSLWQFHMWSILRSQKKRFINVMNYYNYYKL